MFASWTVRVRDQEFFALLLTLVTGVFGVFVSLDLFVFFLFYEIAVLPMYLLIGIWGSTGEVRPQGLFAWAFRETGVGTKEYAAMKLTLYLLLGSAFILVGLFVLYFAGGVHSFSLLALSEVTFPPATQRWVFLALYVGFGILAGIWPLHTWSPDGHASAPTAVSMLHAGVLMKLGAYGVMRVAMVLLPEATQYWAPLVGAIAVINVVYGAFSAMAQTDLKYVIAYSSVSHMGLVMLGAATLTEAGLNGAVFQMFAHGIMTGLFFALVGLIYEKSHTREIGRMGGFGRRMPGDRRVLHARRPVVPRAPRARGVRRRDPDLPRRLAVGRRAGGSSPRSLGTLLTAIYVLRAAKRIFWGPLADRPARRVGDACPTPAGPEWVSLRLPVGASSSSSASSRGSRSRGSTRRSWRSSTGSGCCRDAAGARARGRGRSPSSSSCWASPAARAGARARSAWSRRSGLAGLVRAVARDRRPRAPSSTGPSSWTAWRCS